MTQPQYASHPRLDRLTKEAVISIVDAQPGMLGDAIRSVKEGQPMDYLALMIKKEPARLLRASPDNKEARYQSGNRLLTYNRLSEDGTPLIEVGRYGTHDLTSDSVIIQNIKPFYYPKGHNLEGKVIKGIFNEDSTFTPIKDKSVRGLAGRLRILSPLEILHNEYASTVGDVKKLYGVTVTPGGWRTELKIKPSYVLTIPADITSVQAITSRGTKLDLHAGDHIVIDFSVQKDKSVEIDSVHGVEDHWLHETYVSLEDHLSRLNESKDLRKSA